MKYFAILGILFYLTVSGHTQDSWGLRDMTSPYANLGRWDAWWPRPSYIPWYPRRRSRVWRENSHEEKHSSNSSYRHDDHHHDVWQNFIPVPVPYPVPQFSPNPPLPSSSSTMLPQTSARPALFPTNLGSFGIGAAGSSTTSTSSLLPPGPISATVTLTGPGGVPLRATTTSSNGVFSIPSLFQNSAGSSPAAQAAAQVVAAAQAAYNAQAAYQAQASEAARAATQAAYAQQAAAVARNAASSVSSSLGAIDQVLQPLPPF